ncbi:MAG: hypothetical protein A2W31_00930 [Planctomycetes bacterium RBG_16_64_10]|nr:MAG: hypothetical protein A2W31_00930 [Planctomycetes bacterium RBG_16_64_10]
MATADRTAVSVPRVGPVTARFFLTGNRVTGGLAAPEASPNNTVALANPLEFALTEIAADVSAAWHGTSPQDNPLAS